MADAVLDLAIPLAPARLDWDACSDGFQAFLNRGVTIVEDGVIDDEEVHMHTGPTTYRRVKVDVTTVLREALAPLNITVDDVSGSEGSFLRLSGKSIPEKCDAFFACHPKAPLYAARPFSTKPASLVVHVAEEADAAVLGSMGVLPLRLRELELLESEELTKRCTAVAQLHGASGSENASLDASSVAALQKSRKEADPAKVVEYARTADDRLFEAATAFIMAPLCDVYPLGAEYTGRPFPDGLLTDTTRKPWEVATYDCKSKEGDAYTASSCHGDQQKRYGAILTRLEREQWNASGAIVFTPAMSVREFEDKTQKEFWRQLTEGGRKLIFIPATALDVWRRLAQHEGTTKMRTLFDRAAFWRALFDGELPGLTPTSADFLWPQRNTRTRLLGDEQAELCFLAGLAETSAAAGTLVRAIGAADPNAREPVELGRPQLVSEYHAILRGSKPRDLKAITGPLSISAKAACYLVHGKGFAPKGEDEAGERGFINQNLLRGLAQLS